MKNVLLSLFVVSLVLSSCTSKSIFKLTGKIKGADGEVVTLNSFSDGALHIIDTLKIVDGVVNYEKVLKKPTLLVITDKAKHFGFDFFGENAAYTINGNVDNLKTVNMTGGDLFKQYAKNKTIEAKLRDFSNKLNADYSAAVKVNDTVKIKSIKSEFQAEQKKAEAAKISIIDENPASLVSALLAYKIYSGKDFKEISVGLKKLDVSLKSNEYYQLLSNRVKTLKATQLGKVAPVFEAKTPEGKVVSLSDYRGNLLLLDFGASWCFWCKKELPNMRNVYKKYHDKGFTILSVSFDTKRDAWLNMIKEDKLPWDQASNLKGFKDAAAKEYGITGIPQIYLIGKDGKILAKDLRGEKAMDTAISNALK